MHNHAFTSFLQRFWNKTSVDSTGLIVKRQLRLSAVGQTSTYIKRMAFELVVLYLREHNVVASTNACLHSIQMLTTFRHCQPSPLARAILPENVNVSACSLPAPWLLTHGSTRAGALWLSCPNAWIIWEHLSTNPCRSILSNVPHALTKGFQNSNVALQLPQGLQGLEGPCQDEIKAHTLYQARPHCNVPSPGASSTWGFQDEDQVPNPDPCKSTHSQTIYGWISQVGAYSD